MDPVTRAACYIRVSTEEQTEYSPDAQQRALARYASQHGLTILPEHIYLDAGLSGRRAETRPAFMAMIAAAKEKPPPFDCILVHRFDRFARSREDSIVYKSMLRRQCGVQVISITEHLEDDKMSLILEAMLEAMAEYYSINLSDEVRKGMTEKARRGQLQTAPPFGYQVRENTLVPVPQEALVVREIYRRFLAGQSMAAIARWTQQAGALTHRGNPLDSRRVRYILTNPVYLGNLRWTSRGETLAAEETHEALVGEETFCAAQERLDQFKVCLPKHSRPPEERKHWLAGLARCAACGGGLILSQGRYLKCGHYAKGKCTVSQHVPAQDLAEAVLARLRADAAAQTPFAARWIASEGEQTRQAAAQALAAVERKLRRLREAYLCGADSPQEYKQEKESLARQAEQLRQQMAGSQSGWDGERTDLAQILAAMEDPQASTEEKHRAAQAVLASCVWDKEKRLVRLVYRWRSFGLPQTVP